MLSLTATELPRFMACNGSQLLPKLEYGEPNREVADEGDAIHWLIEQVHGGHFSAEELIDRKAPNGVYITPDMVEHASQFLSDAGRNGAVEAVTNHAGNGWEIRGRCDYYKLDNTTLDVWDFKYGWKIVEPEMNWTLISHAIGLVIGGSVATPQQIRFRIYQPRPYHRDGQVREWVIDYTKLFELYQQIDATLNNPTDQCVTGSHCYKCPSMTVCQANQVASMNSIDVAYRAFQSDVSNESLSYILTEIDRASEALKQAKDAYSDMAVSLLKKGQSIPDYSIESGKGQTRWKEGMTPEIVQMLTGVDVSKKALITPNQAKKAGVDEQTIEGLTERPNTGFKLVKVDGSKKAEKLLR